MKTSQQSASFLFSNVAGAFVFVAVLWAIVHLGQRISHALTLLP